MLPDVEKALRWLEELQGRQFIGTESRLKLLIELIGELAQGATEDKELQLEAELYAKLKKDHWGKRLRLEQARAAAF